VPNGPENTVCAVKLIMFILDIPNETLAHYSLCYCFQVDHWLDFSASRLSCQSEFSDAVAYLNNVLGPITYLVGHDVTIADFAVWGCLRGECIRFLDIINLIPFMCDSVKL
jgi:hypothetical protein